MDARVASLRMIRRNGLLTITALCGIVPAQINPDTRPSYRILGIARSEGGRALGAAKVEFYPATPAQLAIFQDWKTTLTPAKQAVRAQTQGNGRFQLRVPSAEGALLLTYPSTGAPLLGSLRLGPQPTSNLDCHPLAQLDLQVPSDIWIVAIAADGQEYQLGKRSKVSQLRLPAGEYRFLRHQGLSIEQVRMRLRAGAKAMIPITQDLTKTVIPGSTHSGVSPGALGMASHPKDIRISLRDWPAFRLPASPGQTLLPIGPLPMRLLIHEPIARGEILTELWAEQPKLEVPASGIETRSLRILKQGGQALDNATVVTAQKTTSGWSLRSISSSDEMGQAILPKSLQSGWVFVSHQGYATMAQPLSANLPELSLSRATSLDLRILDPRGNPVAGALFEILPSNPLLRTRHRTDHLGKARVVNQRPGKSKIHLLDPRFLRSTHPLVLRAETNNAATLRTKPGASLQGKVLLPNGKPAPGATIRVQDHTTRLTLTDATGRFQLTGLDLDATVRISANLTWQGKAYISVKSAVTPGATTWILKLQTEDPELPGRRKK
jgi:hypothetical protein